jgi:hypothetical protein
VYASAGGRALGGLVSALASLTALTRLKLDVTLWGGSYWNAPPLVLP